MPTKLEARVSQHDREIAAIRKLILTGMRMIAETQASQRENARELKALTASQRETDRELKALIRSLRGGTNGHSNLR
ncbi:MAG: hypothetical protein LAQ69_14735 [Acidobacteriia bacterium]|nr:hypothetical protein [Terriglobia bacterium]